MPPPSPQEAKAFVAQHGLRSCVPGRALGKGGAGHVDLVEVTLPDGTILKAARKTILLGPGRNGKAIMRSILYQELAGLTAAAGCEHAVQCLGYRLPTDDDETAELLLSFADGGSVEDLLVGADEAGGGLGRGQGGCGTLVTHLVSGDDSYAVRIRDARPQLHSSCATHSSHLHARLCRLFVPYTALRSR